MYFEQHYICVVQNVFVTELNEPTIMKLVDYHIYGICC